MYREDMIHKLSVSCIAPWPEVSRYTIVSCIVTSLVGNIQSKSPMILDCKQLFETCCFPRGNCETTMKNRQSDNCVWPIIGRMTLIYDRCIQSTEFPQELGQDLLTCDTMAGKHFSPTNWYKTISTSQAGMNPQQAAVLREHHSTIVTQLSTNHASFNKLLDILLADGLLIQSEYNNLLVNRYDSPNGIGNKVRNFMGNINNSLKPNCFRLLCDGLYKADLNDLLQLLVKQWVTKWWAVNVLWHHKYIIYCTSTQIVFCMRCSYV